MVYGLRRSDGSYDARSAGAFVERDGRWTSLERADYTIEVLDQWRSPVSGATYPGGWRITLPAHSFEAVVTPYVDDQELRTENSARVTYWEGAVRVEGTRDGRTLKGEGYVELTGYARPLRF
jgi:predicted secreted hydrolase